MAPQISPDVSGCVPGCIACREKRAHLRPEPDIVQVQKEAWAQIRQEEREGKRQPTIMRLASKEGK